MGGMWLSGLGDGISQAGSMLASYGQDQMYDKRMAAAEKAREARVAADAERQQMLEATTPVARRPFMGDMNEGPQTLRAERINKFGDVIDTEVASQGEQAEYRQERLSDQLKQKEAADKLVREESRFRKTEAGKDRRANRPRSDARGPAPRLFYMPDGDPVWVRPGDPIPKGASTKEPKGSQPTDPNDWLSQF